MYKYAGFKDTTTIEDAINLKHKIIDAEPDYKTLYPLHYAMRSNNHELLEIVLSSINLEDHKNKKDDAGKIPADYKNEML